MLERAGLAEAPLANMKSDSAKQKGTMAVLEVLVEVRGAVASLAGMEEAGEEREEGVEWKGVERQTYCLAACHVCNCGTFVAGRDCKRG